MSRFHLCNTFFEREMEENSPRPLDAWIQLHPAFRLLQFLPLLYAEHEDFIFVDKLPPTPDPRLIELSSFTPKLIRESTVEPGLNQLRQTSGSLETWGPSRSIFSWAQKKELSYPSPSFELTAEIQSKKFVHQFTPRLSKAALLTTFSEVNQWIQQTDGPKVLKTIFGTSANGHFHLDRGGSLASFLERSFSKGHPVIGEPWVERTFDFSSQWHIGSTIELLGLTVFETSSSGSYQATHAGPQEKLFKERGWAIEPHLYSAQTLLKQIQKMGFFGSLGIDSFIYLDNGREKLWPIVELNARKTMSWVALQIQQKKYQQQVIRMSFENRPGGILPGSFKKNIFIEKIV